MGKHSMHQSNTLEICCLLTYTHIRIPQLNLTFDTIGGEPIIFGVPINLLILFRRIYPEASGF